MTDSNWNIKVGAIVDTSSISKQLAIAPKQTVTITPIFNTKGLQTGEKVVRTFADSIGNSATQVDKLDMSGKTVSSTFTKVKSSVDTTIKSLQTASKHTKTLGQDFIATAGKVAKFGAITAIFGLITNSIRKAVTSVKELDASLIELQKVSDLSGDSLENYTQDAFSMAKELKSTASEVTDAVTEFAKSSYTLEESQSLAKQAIIFQTIADGAISASDSATMLIQVMKAYNMTVDDSVKIIDSINEVDKLAFPFGNIWVIKDNYIGQTLGIGETEERLIDKIKIKVDNFKEKCYNIVLRNNGRMLYYDM